MYFSEDGSINIYTVRDGMYVRSIFPATFGSAVYKLDHIELSYQGHVVLAGHSQDVHSMHVYTINGHLLTSRLAMLIVKYLKFCILFGKCFGKELEAVVWCVSIPNSKPFS